MKDTEAKQVIQIDVEDGFYGALSILHSNAGYYIGRIFHDRCCFTEPGSRESEYFSSKKDAEFALNNGFEWRDCIENQFLYDYKNFVSIKVRMETDEKLEKQHKEINKYLENLKKFREASEKVIINVK